MKKGVSVLLFVLFIILVFFGWKWYKKTVICCDSIVEEIVVEEAIIMPLMFDCTSDTVIISDTWEEKKQLILSMQGENDYLTISIPHFSSESEEVARSRGNNVVELFFESEVIYDIYYLEDCEEAKGFELHGMKYQWKENDDAQIIRLEDEYVNYKYNSDQALVDEATRAYFEELSTFLVSSQDSVVITGHTDDIGSEAFNYELGLERAISFEEQLIELGVDQNQMSVASEGELSPLVENDSKENRQVNRRVQIDIIE